MSTYGQARSDAMDEIYRKTAADVVGDMALVLAEPAIDPSPIELERFPWLDLSWYRKASRQLEAVGFRTLRDLDATPLTAKGAPASCVRVMLSEDGRTSVALYHVIPRSPGFLVKSILWLMRQWKKPKIVEFSSYTNDGRVISTSNQGEVNQFSPAPNCLRRSIPLSASLEEVLAAHQAHLESTNATLRSFRDFESLNAAREEQRAKQNAWRREVGLLPEELDRMLAPHGANGAALRPYIERLLRERAAAGS